MLTAVDRG